MPIYEIQHNIPLTRTQKDFLAEAITHIHSQKFTTPKLFVQVYYTDISQREMYIGGTRRTTGNHIRGQVRSGPSRSQQDWDDLCKAVAEAWERTMDQGQNQTQVNANGVSTEPKTKNSEHELRSVILMGGMVGGLEAGFILPAAGGDVQWLQDNWDAFQQKALAGDEDFVELVREVEERGLMDGSGGNKTAAQKLEEMLGWGDSA